MRQLIRVEPLETTAIEVHGAKFVVPTEVEILRIRAVLILKRNATRDCLDTAALIDDMGREDTVEALERFDLLYPQPNAQFALTPLQVQLADPLPYDLDALELPKYKDLDPKWHDWHNVTGACRQCSIWILQDIITAQRTIRGALGEEPRPG